MAYLSKLRVAPNLHLAERTREPFLSIVASLRQRRQTTRPPPTTKPSSHHDSTLMEPPTHHVAIKPKTILQAIGQIGGKHKLKKGFRERNETENENVNTRHVVTEIPAKHSSNDFLARIDAKTKSFEQVFRAMEKGLDIRPSVNCPHVSCGCRASCDLCEKRLQHNRYWKKRGCDGSVLLNSTNNQAEKNAPLNLTVRGFDFIDRIKSLGVVSCADILTLAGRDTILATVRAQSLSKKLKYNHKRLLLRLYLHFHFDNKKLLVMAFRVDPFRKFQTLLLDLF
ncbi:uncharacterized protein LOC111241154 [Vigna radiata var. radiata]|uniref:peroxidase n=1 Tax=Vigna radiata var. radiata TaxID=3916 RepID=A0A3Q0EPF1_VIGRR|nr:uncharacterized protein LOC111241154 [Vigna radiata var. radiata]